MTDTDEPGVLAGRYRLIRRLGQGSMGALWEAEHVSLRSTVAIKLIHQDARDENDATTRFLREARAAATLRSPHVVQVLDYGVHRGTPFIAMELLEGQTLAARIQYEGKLSPEFTSKILTHVARALTRAHEAGIIHRDLKPSNVFLVSNDDEELAKVLDFGIAKSLDPSDTLSGEGTKSGVMVGTPYYMSPEQAAASGKVDASTDIWAMGILAFECLLGRLPFLENSLGGLILAICARPLPVPSACGTVPDGFDAWFARACAREPDQRFSSARDAASAFRALLDKSPVVDDETTQAAVLNRSDQLTTARKVRRTKAPTRIVWLLGAAALTLSVLWWWRAPEPSASLQEHTVVPLSPHPLDPPPINSEPSHDTPTPDQNPTAEGSLGESRERAAPEAIDAAPPVARPPIPSKKPAPVRKPEPRAKEPTPRDKRRIDLGI